MQSQVIIGSGNFSEYNYIVPYIRYCNEDKYQLPWELKNRKIGDYEFIFVTRGTGEFIINGTCHTVRKNNLLLLKPGIIHSGRSVELPFEFFCIHFDLYASRTETKQGNRVSIPKRPVKYSKAVLELPEFINMEDSGYLFMVVKRIIYEFRVKNKGFDIVSKALFTAFLFDVLSRIDTVNGIKTEKNEYPKAVQEIVKYIENNYMNKIMLADVSLYIHLETTYVSKLFKKVTGYSFSEYLKQYRLSIAKKLLYETDKKADEIAITVGFYDLHHFSRVFKAEEGIAPSQFRSIKRY